MVATFNGKPSATIISSYSPTNVSEETDLITFYDVRNIPKHNVLVISRDMKETESGNDPSNKDEEGWTQVTRGKKSPPKAPKSPPAKTTDTEGVKTKPQQNKKANTKTDKKKK